MIQAVAADDRFTHVRVAREAEAVGICAGAFFGGVNSIAIMGMAGVLAIVHELATLNLMHDIPLLIVTSLRGQPEEEPHTVYQVVQGQVGVPVMQALGIYHHTVDRFADLDIQKLVKHSRITKRPAVVSMTHHVVAEFAG
jgi:sulfopyruvate decarboxylase subunit alpha